MRSEHESNGRAEADEDSELRLLFQQSTPMFARVNVKALIQGAATDARHLAARPRLVESHVNTEVGDVVGERDSRSLSKGKLKMFQRIGVLGACAASVCIALVLGLWENNAVLAQVQDAIRKVRTASYTVTHSTGDKQQIRWEVKLLSDNLCRLEQPNGIYMVFDVKGKRIMEVNPAESKVRITENLPVPDDYNIIATLVHAEVATVEHVAKLPNRTIDGKEATGFVIEENGVRFNVWIDPTTKLPLQMERSGTPTLENSPPSTEKWSDFRFDEPLDESLFSFVVPEGFAVDTRQSPAAKQQASPSYGFGPKEK